MSLIGWVVIIDDVCLLRRFHIDVSFGSDFLNDKKKKNFILSSEFHV